MNEQKSKHAGLTLVLLIIFWAAFIWTVAWFFGSKSEPMEFPLGLAYLNMSKKSGSGSDTGGLYLS
jgi:hypothetical protein